MKGTSSSVDLPPGIDVPFPSDGNGGTWRLLTVAKDTYTAHIIIGRLESEGIDHFLQATNSSPGGFLKPFGDPMAPARIYVRRWAFDDASMILHASALPSGQDEVMRDEAPRWVRVPFVVATLLAVSLLIIFEIVGFGPCVLGFLCF